MPAPGGDETRAAGPRLVGGSALFFAGRLAGAGATFASHWVLARWLGTSKQGQYADVFSWVILLGNLVILGFPRAGLRFLPEALERGDAGQIRGFVVCGQRLVIVLGLLLCLIGAPLLVAFAPAGMNSATWTALVGLACVPVMGWIRQSTGIAHGLSWFRLTVLPSDVVRPVGFLVLLLLGWWLAPTLGAPQVMGMQLTVLFAVALWQHRTMTRHLRPIVQGVEPQMRTGPWLRTAAPLLLVDLFTHFFPELNVAVAGRLMGDDQVGVYFIGFRVAFLIAFGLIAVDQATLPGASRAFASGDLKGMQAQLQRASRLKLAGALLGLALLALAGRPLLASFDAQDGGISYVEAYVPMLLVALMLCVRAATGPVAELLGLTGFHNRTLRVSAVSMLATVALHMVLIPRYGLVGAAIAPLLVTVISHLWMLRILVREVRIVPSVLGRA